MVLSDPEYALVVRVRNISSLKSDQVSDDSLYSLIVESGMDLDEAAARGWEAQAAMYTNLVDVSESGSSRSLSQMSKNALALAKHIRDSIKVTAETELPLTRVTRTRAIERA